MSKSVALGALLLAATCAAQTGAQAPSVAPAVDLEPILQKLHASAEAVTQTLPSFTCREHIDSREWNGSAVVREVKVDSLFREVRDTDPAAISPFTDSRVNPTDGSIVNLVAHTPPLPLIVGNRFWVTIRNVAPADRTHMHYSILPFEPAGSAAAPTSSIRFAYHGYFPELINGIPPTRRVEGTAWVDSSSRLLRTENKSTALPRNGSIQSRPLTTVVDYAPVTLDGVAYDLPSRIRAELHDPSTTEWSDFTATYSDCNLFKATVTILPSSPN